MSITHIVLVAFKPTVQVAAIHDVCQRLLDLKSRCVHPQTKTAYIKGFTGGRDNSPEGMQGAYSHAFVAHFETEEDRRWYVESDPEHLAVGKVLVGLAQKIRVVDFTPGAF
ncbi:MAG: hypothetical protein M1832_000423 [Thelocarpon impressellum]|nr:MAG: hypothetical protein M1832_000423 [Thelocarpon impressellum]